MQEEGGWLPMSEALLALLFGALVGWFVTVWLYAMKCRDERLCLGNWRETLRLIPANPHAYKLGQVVEARVYEGSEWEPMKVVAVSHKGAVAVRPVMDPECPARWIDKRYVEERVRWQPR